MGKFSRDKGARNERKLVGRWTERKHIAQRVPLSGGAGGRFSGDLDVAFHWAPKVRYRIEAKVRADGFKTLYDYIDGNDMAIVGRDRDEPLIVMRLGDFFDLLEETKDNDTVL
jgi:Holliday junction resolvase